MDSDVRRKLSNLVRDTDLERLELQLLNPNIFYILRIEEAEIRHSNFLAWLLNPRQSHSLADLFLRRFLKDIFSSQVYNWIDEFSVDSMDLSDIEIRREWNSIDVLIVAEDFVVCIENKFWSADHSGQLQRYKRTVSNHFPRHHHAFVYMTPFGSSPAEKDEAEGYQILSYDTVVRRIDELLGLYTESLPMRTRLYIEDYLSVLRREIMRDDGVNELARKIYNAHTEALDFILENRPDRLLQVARLFEQKIKDSGWVLASLNKGYTRFLTDKLVPIIPHSGGPLSWKYKEAFLFEFDYWPKKITFKTVISPGTEEIRTILTDTIAVIEGARKPKGKQWIVHFAQRWSFDVTDVNHNDEHIGKKLDEIWPIIRTIVDKVENALISVQEALRGREIT